ncbi:hypothetical protein I2I05_11540 [Hymenobacter sp. BT683]|uniref:Phage tail protein n=1 Tax=Hymenobacter jeongseonensis TaxID=2791027 RepID=A0ABS0II46_9BACT|nr:hypothetical protein [Hymenobacter jeongseonensis]MBF9238027.1 hypothetical protein [Hymenobacter jeongseonensis]
MEALQTLSPSKVGLQSTTMHIPADKWASALEIFSTQLKKPRFIPDEANAEQAEWGVSGGVKLILKKEPASTEISSDNSFLFRCKSKPVADALYNALRSLTDDANGSFWEGCEFVLEDNQVKAGVTTIGSVKVNHSTSALASVSLGVIHNPPY